MKDNAYNDHYDNPIDEIFLNTAWENMSRRLDEELPIAPVLPIYSNPEPHRTWLVAAGLLLLLSLATWGGYAFGKYNALAAQAKTIPLEAKGRSTHEAIHHQTTSDNNATTSNNSLNTLHPSSLGQFLFTPIFFYVPSTTVLPNEQEGKQLPVVPSNVPMLAEENPTPNLKLSDSEPLPSLVWSELNSTIPKKEKALWTTQVKAPRLPNLHVALQGGVYSGDLNGLIGGEYASVVLAKKTDKWTFETGLSYSFLKTNQQINYGIVVPQNSTTGGGGSTNSPSRQVNTGFHVNNLHYVGIPLSIACRTSNRFSINAGVQFNHLVRVNIEDSFNAPNLVYNNSRFFNAKGIGFDKEILGNTTAGDFNHNNIGANMGFTYHLSSNLGVETNYYWNMRPYWKSYEGH
ncbi:MAG: hypothetical protein RLZZ292_1258, partial [Bacteroidota bacterium]